MTLLPRRVFLQHLGAGLVLGAGAPILRGAADLPMTPSASGPRMRLVDAHGHLGFGPDLRLPAERLLRAADAVGIERIAVSVPSGPQPHHVAAANDFVLAAMRAHPDRILGQCCVNPLFPAAALEEVRRCLGEGMCGLGELYTYARADDPVWFPIVELCIADKAPLLWHARADLGLVRRGHPTGAPAATTTASHLVALAQRYPEAILIHGHLGGGGDWEQICKVLRPAATVYLDTSGSVSEPGMLEFAVRQLGAERLLFATDANLEVNVARLYGAGLTPAQRERIGWTNFNEILRQRGLHAH
jgi:predicted TIM-barrel fold metal-dependent hydrolase